MSSDPKFSADIRPEPFSERFIEPTRYVFPIVIAIILLFAAAAVGGYYFYSTADMFNPYKKTYELLGVDLPRSFERFGLASSYLDQLKREPCDSMALSSVSKLMEAAGYPRESATSLEHYSNNCSASAEMLESAYAIFNRIADSRSAIRVADSLIKIEPASGRYRFLRGTAQENAKNYKAALVDYISTLELFTDLSHVAGTEFYRVSRMYDLIGRPCDAIAPLETFLSYNVKERQTQQIARMISDYSNKGKCAATYSNGSARVIIPPTNQIDVVINGSRARMIIDTGATMVSITPEFSVRARIIPDDTNLVEVKVVGSVLKQATGYAQTIQVGDATAANVPVLISVGSQAAFGPGIDGLLGMTFLSRFNVILSPGLLELKPRTRT